jgi:hypothetical protein
MDPFGVVILQCVSSPKHAALGRRCWQSVRQVYPHVPILVVDDSPIDCPERFWGDFDPLVTVVQAPPEMRGAGEILPYVFLHKLRPFAQALVLHDSMVLRAPLPLTSVACACLWTFEPHIWNARSTILPLLQALPRASHLAMRVYENTRAWKGCFGGAALIQLAALDELEKTFGFLSLAHVMRTRDARMAFERVLGVLRAARLGESSPSLFGDIFKHPAFETNDLDAMRSAPYDAAVLKTWHGR